MISMTAKIVLLFACVSACVAHLCMLSPPQRSTLAGINKAGSDSCFMLEAPCGKQKPNTNKLYLRAGSNFTVVFQKNLDHFNAVAPGYWSVAMGSMDDEKNNRTFTELYRTPDTSIPTLSIIYATITVPVPAVREQPMVLQTQYVTNNPKAPPFFYQCADVVIMM